MTEATVSPINSYLKKQESIFIYHSILRKSIWEVPAFDFCEIETGKGVFNLIAHTTEFGIYKLRCPYSMRRIVETNVKASAYFSVKAGQLSLAPPHTVIT